MNALTFGDLSARAMRLAILCRSCGRLRYVRSTYPETAVVSDLAKTMQCVRCRSEDVELIGMERDRKSGFWPAEAG
ncbi:hypothetical protein HDIA_4124 [Hartmannibacter diazotrophicus]|uniref:Uncharacterized protein n=1 Tax=Hartmannibacter diazotrophicus TaxID=1482074 RepID=A0A2C9DDG8_9HYPH|nr:hypothetical protein HDIA_4124 [Hartmannibacter diazotrophicus]